MTPAEIEKLLADYQAGHAIGLYDKIDDLARLALDQARELAAKDDEIEKWQSLCIGPLSAATIISEKDARIAELEATITAQSAERDALKAAKWDIEVKPLIWVMPADGRGVIASSAVGQYAAFDEGYPRWAFSQRGGYQYHISLTFETAKATAQADYERRIRAALKEQPE